MFNFSQPILFEVPPSSTNVQLPDDEVEELCTTDCHTENCICEKQNVNNNEEYDSDNAESDNSECEDCDSETEIDAQVYPEPNYNTLNEEIKKMQQELDQKLKLQKEIHEREERAKQQKLQEEQDRKRKEREEQEKKFKTEKRTELVNKINQVVAQYNEQSKKCDQLLKTYAMENTKLNSINSEYYKLKYQIDMIDKPANTINGFDFGLNQILFPWLDMMHGK
jgi:Skp family chaperone for outer membrane proteins